ncbi:MAG: chromosome segregation protein SMC [Bryobacteraceae bacterium]
MLKLKRVELQGFKSFCDRTDLKFSGSGIAAVVGPNGCGKSNLSDAISWVLGEQSARTLRGARMEDVIFAGTKARKPLGMASVTMTLVDPAEEQVHYDLPAANGNGHAPVESARHSKAGEMTITRRLFRSGESEYLINGRAARLRDIQDLFMGTGLGPESYAIIEQGRIGQILSSKPQDRRAVLEEAAGITRYKTKRRLAEAKLETARQNLARVFDILEEVTRQVNSLKRQAGKAKRYIELKADMDAQLGLLLAGRWSQLQQESVQAEADLSAATEALQSFSGQVGSLEQEHASEQSACFDLEAKLTEARRQVAEWNVELERAKGRLEYQARQSAAIEQRMSEGEGETQLLDERLASLQQDLGGYRENVARLERETADARARVIEKNEAREALQKNVRDRERALETGRTQVLRLLGEASTLKNQLAQIQEYLAGIERETARAQREGSASAADLERLDEARKALSQTVSARQLELETITGDRRRTEEELTVRKSRASEARRSIEALREEHSRIKARKDSLEEVLAHRSYTTDAVKRLFGAVEKGGAQDLKPLGVLADFIEVDPAYEKAAEEFLHEELEYIVVESWQQAERGIDLMRTGLEGRATFLVQGRTSTASCSDKPGGLAYLADRLRVSGDVPLPRRAARCYVVEDRAEGQRLSVEYPDLYFLLPDGVSFHGQAITGGKKKGGGPLALKREVRELAGAIEARQREFDAEIEGLEELDREIALLEGDLERLRAAQEAREKDALALQHEMRKLAEESNRANSRLSVAKLELERLHQERERSLRQRETGSQALEQKENARKSQEEELEAARQSLEDLQAEAARIGEEHAVQRVELAGLEERQRSERAVLVRTESQLNEMTARRQTLTAEIQKLGVERARLLADNIELDRTATSLSGRILTVESEINRLSVDESRLRASLASRDEELKRLRVELEAARDRRSQIELDLVRKQAECKYLDETCRKELNKPVEELASTGGTLPQGEELAAAELAYADAKSRLEAMGPVNLQAQEEYEETQQRQEFLAAQRQDLIDSIRDTEKAIQEIEVVSRQKFAAAFEAINANFRETFQTLFGGGTGEMRLTDESNLADSGIDIVASPPGKKLQNVLLLSGGEKALTALSLLMAIFRYQPSPFCVLDEVDAPLDEANIGRLMRLLREMASETQFVIITHSKKTMESAQTMYGVTMQEPGVSKLVSVRFDGMAAAGRNPGESSLVRPAVV